MPCPGTAFFRGLMDEDGSTGGGNRVRAEVERSTGETMISGDGKGLVAMVGGN